MASFYVRTRTTPVAPEPGLTYGPVGVFAWADDTADALAGQFNRLNPVLNAQPTFYMMTTPSVTSGYTGQFACEIDGVVEPDANLGGDLFLPVNVLERPVGLQPIDVQQAATSAVHNIVFRAYGHYTLLFARANHGARIVHFDVREP